MIGFCSKVRFKKKDIHISLRDVDFCLIGFDDTAFALIEWNKKGGMAKMLEKLNEFGSVNKEVIIYQIDLNREYFNNTTRQKSTIREYVDQEIESSMILFLDEMGLLKNLYDEEEEVEDGNVPVIPLKKV